MAGKTYGKYGKSRRRQENLFDFQDLQETTSTTVLKNSNNPETLEPLDQLALEIKSFKLNPLSERNVNLPDPSSRKTRVKKSRLPSASDSLCELLSLSYDPEHRNSKEPQPFSEWSSSVKAFFSVVKIAEASYGQVYTLQVKPSPGTSSNGIPNGTVLKILSLKSNPTTSSNPTCDSTIDSVISEVKLLQRMSDIPGFTVFRDIRVLKGRPSSLFVKAWKKWNTSQKKKEDKSVFPDPSKASSYSPDQLWVVIEMDNAGTDLERAGLDTVWTVWDVFWGVTLALAKGEQEAKFEHRDLHDGNVCVKPRNFEQHVPPKNVKVKGYANRKLGFTGLEATLIDYTLSRAETITSQAGNEQDIAHVDYLDLATHDAAIFEGDASKCYQYDIYRYMRSAVFFSDPTANYNARQREVASTGRSWAGFHPQTNLVWLHFLCHILLAKMIWPTSETNMNKSLEHVEYESSSRGRKVAEKKARQLARYLKVLKSELNIRSIPRAGFGSASDLVELALEKGWLNEEDVIGVTDISFLGTVDS